MTHQNLRQHVCLDPTLFMPIYNFKCFKHLLQLFGRKDTFTSFIDEIKMPWCAARIRFFSYLL